MQFVGPLLGCAFLISSASAFADDLNIVGTGDGIPILRAVGAAFTAENPGTLVLVPPSIHSGGAIREVIAGTSVLGRIARPLNEDESKHGIVVTPIFRQSVTFFAHPSARVKSLSVEQTAKIYTGEITNWRQLGGSDLRIKVVRREDVDSAVMAMRSTLPGWQKLKFLERSKIATTTQEAFYSVETTVGSIGFGPYSADLDSRVTVLRLDGVHPSDARYPTGLTLALIHRPATVTEPALRFLDFVSAEKAQQIIHERGALPIAKRQTM